ncbi:MAG: ribonuclease HI [Candidatus Marinimicrobia bacterium]|nr:ribonuclease HI [Candidatus Neomarinimicrobiota bacterium]
MTDLPRVDLFTDGACRGNPGPGGWGLILRFDGTEKELAGGEKDTTNNRMELTAVIRGLEALNKPCRLTVHTDSRYIVDAFEKGWLDNWIARGWRRAATKGQGKPVLNVDLWQRLLELIDKHQVQFEWVRGHSGHPENERADRLAVGAIPQ